MGKLLGNGINVEMKESKFFSKSVHPLIQETLKNLFVFLCIHLIFFIEINSLKQNVSLLYFACKLHDDGKSVFLCRLSGRF